MVVKLVKSDPYDSDNLRFRRAYIRERLAALKAEREALAIERDRINEELAAKKPIAPNTTVTANKDARARTST